MLNLKKKIRSLPNEMNMSKIFTSNIICGKGDLINFHACAEVGLFNKHFVDKLLFIDAPEAPWEMLRSIAQNVQHTIV